MENNTPTRQSLLRYLLNELPDDERERIDTLLIADEEYHAAFQEAEYDLRDALAAGELTPTEADRARRALPPLSPPAKPFLLPTRRRIAPAIWLPAAALLLVTLALGTRHLLTPRPAPPAISRATPNPAPPPRNTPPAHQPTPQPKSRPAILAVLLLPGASRSANILHLPIPHGATTVRIDWPTPEPNTRYQLQVLNESGKISCTSPSTPHPSGVVHFSCPARDVPTGIDYMRVASLPPDPDLPFLLEVTVSVERDL